MPNPYCEVLGIDVPTLARIEGHPKASTWTRFLLTLMAEGGPLTLEQAAARFEAAGLGAREEALRALKRCQPGRRPVYRHGERYFLDPHDHEADMWAFRLGLRPPRGAGAVDGETKGAPDNRIEDDPREDTSAREDAAAPEPAPLPGPTVPLQPAELEELWSEVDLSRWSAQRVALCVLEAYGAPMAPAEVVERVEALHGPGHRFVADQPHFERRNSAVRVLEDGRWAMVPEHRSIRLARETVRTGIKKLREKPTWMKRESAEEIAARHEAWQVESEASGLAFARLRRAILRGWPVEAPRVLAVYDVDREGAEIFFDDQFDAAKRELERYDVWAGEEIRPLLEGLGIDFAARRLHELRPPQKTIKRNDRGDTLEVTMARLLAGSCGIERRWADATTVDRWIDREQWAQLRDALEAEVEDLAALYRYGRLHRALRIRWRSLDAMVEVPWVHWDEWSIYSYIRRAVEATHDLHEQYVTWSGGAYDPAAFDAHAVHFEDSGRRWVEAWGAG